MLQTSTGPPQDHDRTTDSLDDLDRLLSNTDNFTEFVTTPNDGSLQTPEAREAGPRLAREEGTAPSASLQNRKQRALDKSREAQKRFRQRQRVRLETIQTQLDDTTRQLRDLQIQQQQLQTRNILLEKVAQLSKEQTADDYLAWQNKQAELDFSCAHTEQTPQGFTLTLTIFGQKESKACRTVSKMSLTELAALWTEYMRKLGKCLLSLQQDKNGGARPLLDLWVAEAIALICCVRVYNPEFMKAIDSTAMNGSAAARPGHPLLMQHLELLQFTDAQLQDGLYLRRIAAARAAELARQRHAATQQLLSQSSSKQHPSDHLADSKASSEKLRLIGLEEYKLHGIVTDALFNGIFTSIQNAMGLVHMYPFLPDPLEYLELIAERQGHKDAPTANIAIEADWQTLLAYCAKVTSVDICEHMPLSNFMPGVGPANTTVSADAGAAAVPSSSPVSHDPSMGQRSVHFTPDSATRQAVFQSTQSYSQNGNSDHSMAPNQEPAWSQYSQVPQTAFSPMARQPSRQASSQASMSMVPEHAILPNNGMVPEHAMLRQGSNGIFPEHAMLRQGSNGMIPEHGMVPEHAMLRQGSNGMVPEHALPRQGLQQLVVPEHPMLRHESQHGVPGQMQMQYQLPYSQAGQHAPVQMMTNGLIPVHNPLFQMGSHSMHQSTMPDHMQMHAHLPLHQLPMQRQLSAPSSPSMQASMPYITAQQRLNSNQPRNGYMSQHQAAAGHMAHSQPSGLLPPWIGQNLASAYAVPSSELEHLTPRQPSLRAPSTPGSQNGAPSPRTVYPTAAMRSQQISSGQAPPVTISGNTVQAPLAPFLNEQLKRMLAQSNPSARRGF